MREATTADTGAILDLLLEFYKGASRTLKLPGLSVTKVLKTIETTIERGTIVVVEEDGKIVGALGLQQLTLWYSESPLVGDVFFYILPQYRSSKHASNLLEAAYKYAIMLGLPLKMAIVSGEDVKRKDAYYARKGFRYLGGIYTKGI